MIESNNAYLKLLAKNFCNSEIDYSQILSIITEIYEAGLDGSLCVPVKKKWEPILKRPNLPFIVQQLDGEPFVFFEKIHNLKQNLEYALQKQINQVDTIQIDNKKIESLQVDLETKYSKSINSTFQLNEGQTKAIHQTLIHNFQIISGGPGTGKTTVVAFLLRIMKELRILPEPEDIALVAPTGRAAQRLTESIQQNLKRMGSEPEFTNLFHGQTVHSLLSYKKNEGKFYYSKDRALPYRLILVDEVSMMDLNLMVALFDSLENIELTGPIPFHLILLGDPNQLPSVEKGEVLADFLNEIPANGRHLSYLTKSNRHTEGSPIYQLMKFIVPDKLSDFEKKDNIEFSFPSYNSLGDALESSTGVVWYELPRDNFFISKRDSIIEQIWDFHFIPQMNTIQNWNFKSEDTLKSFSIESFLSELNRFRCLTIFRSGYFGIEGIQTKIQGLATKHFQKQYSLKDQRIYFRDLAARLYYDGMPIIITKNDRSRKLFNGDVGFICRIGGELRAVFCINNELFSFAIDTLPLHEPAFFMTVHKSQGSEYDTVLFYLPEIDQLNQDQRELKRENRLLNKKILYTAITRAKKKVILACDKDTWNTGLSNDPKRVTGFRIQ